MTAATPGKIVRWALDASFASPFSDVSSSESCSSISSLQYINSQLVAHGFVHDSGLSLDGLAKRDSDRVVKCILGMLSQRMDDITRTEDLTTKLRTLSYDHERLTSMFKSEVEKAANAEREMNLHKTRMTAATKSLQSCENAHKHTTAELQRTRTSLHALRATHQTEIKKLEKEKERMVDRWSKLSDTQLKIGSLCSGLTCANLSVVEASEVQLRGKGQGFLDVALEQAENARKELFEQNRKLRGLLLSAANELRSALHAARTVGESENQEEPAPIVASTMFSNDPVQAAGETLNSLFNSLRKTITAMTCSCCRKASQSSPQSTRQDSAELDRLQTIVSKLRAELDEAQKQAAASAAQTQELFDRFAEEQQLGSHGVAELSVDLMTAPARDEEYRRLEGRFKELEEERRTFTEAAVRLGREKAALEAERLKLLEEKRSWEVEMMLAELPLTPGPVASPSSLSKPNCRSSPRKSSRKLKSKVASPRKTRVSRWSSGLAPSPRAKNKVHPAYETEVIPTIPPSPSRGLPAFKTSMEAPPPPSPALLSSAFVLPPPSPGASLQTRQALPPVPPLPKLKIPPASEDSLEENIMDVTPERAWSSSAKPSIGESAKSGPAVPCTPVVRAFPMAKPLAQRMIHAYSPAKPSPLSRILMMADSPESAEGVRMDLLAEVDEHASDAPEVPAHAQQPAHSLAEELGVSEGSVPQSQMGPEWRSQLGTVAPGRRAAAGSRTADRRHGSDKGKAKEKGAVVGLTAPAQQGSRARPGGALEKENVKRAKLSDPNQPPRGLVGVVTGSGAVASSSSLSRDGKKSSAGKSMGIGTRTDVGGKAVPRMKPPFKGGPRRVPMGSAEAAPVPTWRG